MSQSNSIASASAPPARIEPSLGIALPVVAGYAVIFTAIAASSGIASADWFATADNAWRTAVVPLADKVMQEVLLATLSSAILYLFRRMRALLIIGMIAHGLWDISLFLPAQAG